MNMIQEYGFKEKIIACLESVQFQEAMRFLVQWEEADPDSLDMLVLKAETLHQMHENIESKKVINKGLQVDPNHYELYFMKAGLEEERGADEDAYLLYQMSLFLCKDAQDKEFIAQAARTFCENADTTEFKLGESLKNLILYRITQAEYQVTYDFLATFLFTDKKELGKVWITEDTMLLYMLLEITLCDKNHGVGEHQIAAEKFCLNEFKEKYSVIKLLVRRLWFGIVDTGHEIVDYIIKNQISVDMFVIITKYSVPQWMLLEIIKKVSESFEQDDYKFSQKLVQYYLWIQNDKKEKSSGSVISSKKGTYAKYQFARKMDQNLKLLQKSVEIINLDGRQRKNVASTENGKVNSKVNSGVTKNAQKVAFIMCANNQLYSNEVIRYISSLRIPKGMSVEIIVVWNASGMAAGYNQAMNSSDAKYKVYLHQDTFIINPNFIQNMLAIYEGEDAPSMLGIAGCAKTDSNGIWWTKQAKGVWMTWYQEAILTMLESNSISSLSEEERLQRDYNYKEVACLDGILISTSQDIEWREDLFDGWHFYDISQGFEFGRRNLKVACVVDDDMWVMHETTMKKDPKNLYEKYRKILKKEYAAETE